MPDAVEVAGNQLRVKKVDDSVNTTFVCEVKNVLGSAKSQLTAVVIGESLAEHVTAVCSTTLSKTHTHTHTHIYSPYNC